jgi:hydroxymethylpyrimidine/phosphomethylpyrimidine kinase
VEEQVSDSGGGAGIQADLKTFSALGVYGMSVLTSITAQNTLGVQGVQDLPPDFVGLQIDSVMQDIGADAVKTGMLSNTQIIKIVNKKIKEYQVKNLVIDPVMVAKGGDRLLREDAIEALKEDLIPLAMVVTPNLSEAEVLTGLKIKNIDDMKKAARKIYKLGPKNVLIKGGHLLSNQAVDLLYNGESFIEFSSERINTKNTHGTGCTLSSAIAAGLAQEREVEEAVEIAKRYITLAIKNSLAIGHGHGPLNHLVRL